MRIILGEYVTEGSPQELVEYAQLTDNRKDNKRNNTKLTVDFKNTELCQKLLNILDHIAHTTTCEATRVYLAEQIHGLKEKSISIND
ncbi:hypothetical protein [Brevibacillus laterosporus]|uniref:hypothetical protein n=1 Tax=Brevibacillus laterosporus TaxID=1465 RepID=UPI000E6BD296|nr:hypothetical protein [Brevibacillus laterosporus]AYB41040.1 hypothetical protein D5F52_23905 [Brevibacillus laterosporus]MBM7106956.1 hypothetical protein [Brevibacillus laterosporus]